MDSSSFSFDDAGSATRDLGAAFEDIVFGDGEESDLSFLSSEQAIHRGLAVEDSYFEEGCRGLAVLDAGPLSGGPFSEVMGLHDFAPKQPVQAQKAPVPVATRSAPTLTDAIGFVSRDRLFCREGDVGRVAALVEEECAAHGCVTSGADSASASKEMRKFSHFSRAYLSVEFEVRIWNVTDPSRCKCVVPECPCGIQLMVEFHKLSGCSFRWRDLQQCISDALTSKSGDVFFSLRKRAPRPDFSMSLDDDDEEDMEIAAEEEQTCMSNMVKMLQGTFESQEAAATTLVQYCVTKRACDQLVACGFLKAAQGILHQVVLNKSDVHPSQLPLLRCILLTIAQAAACSDLCRSAVAQDTCVRECVGDLHACSPSIFTHELAPLTQMVSV